MATKHYIKGCEFKGFFSELTVDKEEVTCKRCICKYKLQAMKKTSYIVKRNGYLNVLEKGFLLENENVYGKVLI